MHVNLPVTDWVATQWEDPVFKAVINWVFNQKVQNLKHLFGDDANTEEGEAILSEWKKLMLHQGGLYHHDMLAGKLEEVKYFIVPMAHWVADMNRCHQDAGHKGQQQMLHLLQDQFWWPGMATQMQKVISNFKWCIQHESTCAKVPMQPIIANTPLELLHEDFTNIEMTMELHQPLSLVNILIFCDHFTKHVMAYVIPDQTVKTIAKLLWQGYISIFGAPAKFLSNWGANFESNIIKELCELMGIWKVRASPYHAQANGQVEWAHQMLMNMIGKLNRDQKLDWPKHLPELVHAYNSTSSSITGYSPHYLMFGSWLCLPIDFYFPMIWGMEKHWHVNYYIAELCEWLWEAFKEVQEQSTSEARRQKWYYDRKANAMSLEPGNLILAKDNTYKGMRKVKDQWEEELWYARLLRVLLHTSWWMSRHDTQFLYQNHFFSCRGHSPLYIHVSWAGRMPCHHPRGKNTSDRDCESAIRCGLSTIHPATDSRDSSKLGDQEALCCLWMSSGVSILHQGWKVQCRGTRCVWASTLAFLWQRYWSHQWSLLDTAGYNKLNPTSPHSRDCKS